MADTGCQSCLATMKVIEHIGLHKKDLIPVTMWMHAEVLWQIQNWINIQKSTDCICDKWLSQPWDLHCTRHNHQIIPHCRRSLPSQHRRNLYCLPNRTNYCNSTYPHLQLPTMSTPTPKTEQTTIPCNGRQQEALGEMAPWLLQCCLKKNTMEIYQAVVHHKLS